jgi:hypothetical protein
MRASILIHNFLSPKLRGHWSLCLGIICRSVVTQPVNASSHSILHKFSTLIRRYGITMGTNTSTTLLLWTKMKSVILFRDKVVWGRRGYRLFPCTKSCIGIWISLNIILTRLSSMNHLWRLSLEWWVSCCRQILWRTCIIFRSMNLNFFNRSESFLAGLLPFLHRALNFTALPRRYGALLILCANIVILARKLLIIRILRHRW